MPRRSRGQTRHLGVNDANRPLRHALLQFVLRSLAAVIVVALATFAVARSMSEKVAIEDARAHGDAVARIIAAPMVNAGVRAHDPAATAAFANLMLHRVLGKQIVHMKLWDINGTVIWSDETALVGQ